MYLDKMRLVYFITVKFLKITNWTIINIPFYTLGLCHIQIDKLDYYSYHMLFSLEKDTTRSNQYSKLNEYIKLKKKKPLQKIKHYVIKMDTFVVFIHISFCVCGHPLWIILWTFKNISIGLSFPRFNVFFISFLKI